MLYATLFLSSILLMIGNRAFRRSRQPIVTIALSGAGFTFGSVCLFWSSVVAIQALLLVVAAGVCCIPPRKPRAFLALSFGVTVLVYGLASWFALQDCARLRDQFPYVSLQERLPKPPVSAGPLSAAATERLRNLEDSLESLDNSDRINSYRTKALELLHEHTVQLFVNRPGFGVTRMSGFQDRILGNGLRTEPAVPQPVPRPIGEWETGPLEMRPLRPDEGNAEKPLWGMHEQSVSDFVNAQGFGFFKDRRHVAGFQGHQFSKVPSSFDPWTLQTLDLVGLVVHAEPTAYVSANLPRMDELREAPTRPLNHFEATGLAELRRGEDLFVREVEGRLRVLGAVRATEKCLTCHGGQRGDLLGAFSYVLARHPR
jgi:hypothetical protein